MMRKKSKIIFIVASLFPFHLKAQFHYSAPVDSVKATGFYSIRIQPELCSYLKTDLSDLRIVDENKQTVPFIIENPWDKINHPPQTYAKKVVHIESAGTKTVLTIENPNRITLSSFIIELKSAAAERSASLSGSDNNKDWFVILDSLQLHESDKYSDTTYQQRIHFPASTYRYFKLAIDNNKKAALNVLQVLSSATPVATDTIPRFFPNPEPALRQENSGGYSLVTITYPKPMQIGYLNLNIRRPLLYKRSAKFFFALKESMQQTWAGPGLHTITITSDNFSGYEVPLIKSDTLYLLVENGDNPPLEIASVSTAVINREIIAQLEKGKTYSLLMDDPGAKAPVYDLKDFRDRITFTATLNTGPVIALSQPAVVDKTPVSRKWIWPVIMVVVALLSLLTWKLTIDMKKKIEN